MKKWLITGSNGFLGANAARYLSDKAHTVGLARNDIANSSCMEFVNYDLANLENIEPLIFRIAPDYILHTAAVSSHETCENDPQLSYLINASATEKLASAARKIGAKFIYISSDAVFDGAHGAYLETDVTNPFSVYGLSKLEGERLTVETNCDALVVRTNFFGWSPSLDRSILEFFVNALRRGKHVTGYSDFLVTSLYVEHLIQAIWELTNVETSGLIHIGSADTLSKFDFGMKVAEIFGLEKHLIESGLSPSDSGVSRKRNLSLNSSRFESITGKTLQTQVEGIHLASKIEGLKF